jgi:endogenous inhibitor of DNA gyrase (YacG/DUF329 family)
MAKIKCRGCGTEFVAKSKHYRFCTLQCKAHYWNKKSKKFKHICPTCKKEFMGTEKQTYCSQKCWLNSVKHKKKAKTPRKKGTKEKTCLWCRKKFKTYFPNQLYCGLECAIKYRAMLQKIFKKHPFEDTLKLRLELEKKGKDFVLR